MAHVNQGFYKALMERADNTCEEIRLFLQPYIDNHSIPSGGKADKQLNRAKNLSSEVERIIGEFDVLLHSQRFEMSSNTQKYRDMQFHMQEWQRYLKKFMRDVRFSYVSVIQ